MEEARIPNPEGLKETEAALEVNRRRPRHPERDGIPAGMA